MSKEHRARDGAAALSPEKYNRSVRGSVCRSARRGSKLEEGPTTERNISRLPGWASWCAVERLRGPACAALPRSAPRAIPRAPRPTDRVTQDEPSREHDDVFARGTGRGGDARVARNRAPRDSRRGAVRLCGARDARYQPRRSRAPRRVARRIATRPGAPRRSGGTFAARATPFDACRVSRATSPSRDHRRGARSHLPEDRAVSRGKSWRRRPSARRRRARVNVPVDRAARRRTRPAIPGTRPDRPRAVPHRVRHPPTLVGIPPTTPPRARLPRRRAGRVPAADNRDSSSSRPSRASSPPLPIRHVHAG